MRVRSESAMPVTVSLRGDDGSIIAENTITVSASAWTTYQASLTVPEHGDAGSSVATQGTLRLAFAGEGVIDLDFVTLDPRTTYRGLKHFRPDLVEALADLKPRFMRFPGGCITHGLGMDNMYHWDRTIGPVEHRPHNFNLWGYHQSFRIGYYEYLCLCETIGAKPLPVLPAGVSCQNTSQGPVPVAQEDMPAYIDEVLHLIEFCNGSTATEWGAKRAAMGHPEPFGLEYLASAMRILSTTCSRTASSRFSTPSKPHIRTSSSSAPSVPPPAVRIMRKAGSTRAKRVCRSSTNIPTSRPAGGSTTSTTTTTRTARGRRSTSANTAPGTPN